MKQNFQGWDAVGSELKSLAAAGGVDGWPLNSGQCASLLGVAKRLPSNGVVIADEVGMGKTRIAVALARGVIKAGGRVAILVPPGLGFQWRDELRDGGVATPRLLRSLWQYLEIWSEEVPTDIPWFEHQTVLISHSFTNWRLSASSDAWRWSLLPAIYSLWRKQMGRRLPRGSVDNEKLDDLWVAHAAGSIVDAIALLPDSHPVVRLVGELVQNTPWPGALNGGEYQSNESLRPWLERAVGMGLGVFDLVIIDEAHKSRGDQSGLTRMLDRVVLVSDSARRLALTATPVELDFNQWDQTLARIGAVIPPDADTGGDIFKIYADACAKVRQVPSNREARQAFKEAAGRFQAALAPYLLRRDKREVRCVQDFARWANASHHAYRQELEVSVDTSGLDPTWRRAICAAEALSVVSRQADDSVSKRLRLTMGNGHGIAAMLDHSKRDELEDKEQIELDGDITSIDPGPTSAAPDKRQLRCDWWKQVIQKAFTGGGNPLFEHPAIRAAVDAIEAVTSQGEKVLVFGRFTLPLRALVDLLNAREMLRTLSAGGLWAQSGIPEADWPAVEAAHRQLRIPLLLDRAKLLDDLKNQYSELENRRQLHRARLMSKLDEHLPATGKLRKVFEAFQQSADQDSQDIGNSLPLVAKVLYELTGETADVVSPDQLIAAFADLIEAGSDRWASAEAEKPDEDAAHSIWSAVHERLKDEFNRPEGGYARLMNGAVKPETRRLLQLAFNRPASNPRVLVAQSVVGREGLNLHKACKTVILLHPEWNPGVVEQQIGRVDRVGSLWEQQVEECLRRGTPPDVWPRILVRPVVFKGTYDDRNWQILQDRWSELRAQLHGVVIPERMREDFGLPEDLVREINDSAPNFSPSRTAA